MTGRDTHRWRPAPTLVGAGLVAFLVGSAIVGVGGTAAWVAGIAALAAWLGVAGAVGFLSVAVRVSWSESAARGGRAWDRLFGAAAWSAALWTVAAVFGGAASFLATASASSASSPTPGAGEQEFVRFLGSATGSAWVISAIVAAVLSAACFAGRSRGTAFVAICLGVVGALALGNAGVDAAQPVVAARSLLLTSLAVGVGSVAGLSVALQWSPRGSRDRLRGWVLPLTSGAGLWAAVVALVLAIVMIADGAASGPVIVAVACLVAVVAMLVVTGRRPDSLHDPRSPVRSALLGSALGFAVVLASAVTAPGPRVTLHTAPAVVLSGRPVPPPPSFAAIVSTWSIAPGWVAAIVLAIAAVVALGRTMAARGVPPRRGRLAAFALALLVVLFVTSGAGGVYGRFLVSGTILDLVAFSFVVPALLSLATADRRPSDTTGREGGSRGRSPEGIRKSTLSGLLRGAWRPASAAVAIALLWWVILDTGLLRSVAADWLTRDVVDLIMLVLGFLLVTGVTPRHRDQRGALGVMVTLVAGAILGAALIGLGLALSGPLGLLEPGWYGATGRTWGEPPIADQAIGGGVLTAVGILVVVTAVAVAVRDHRRSRSRAPGNGRGQDGLPVVSRAEESLP